MRWVWAPEDYDYVPCMPPMAWVDGKPLTLLPLSPSPPTSLTQRCLFTRTTTSTGSRREDMSLSRSTVGRETWYSVSRRVPSSEKETFSETIWP